MNDYVYTDLDTTIEWTAGAVPCRRSEAHWAVCETCQHVLMGTWPKGVGSSIWLHRHGSCPASKITYYRFA